MKAKDKGETERKFPFKQQRDIYLPSKWKRVNVRP